LRTDAGHAFEHPLQVPRTDVENLPQRVQVQIAFQIFGDVLAHRPHQLHLGRVGAKHPRLATTARTEAGLLRRIWCREERNLLTPRTPRRTRGPAVNAGRAHSIEDLPIKAPVALQDCRPRLVRGECCSHWGSTWGNRCTSHCSSHFAHLTYGEHTGVCLSS